MKKPFLAISLLITISACVDMDLFGASTRDIIGDYELKQWEDNETYYLLGPNETPWGAIDGAVLELGWNEQYIVVLQKDNGNGGGWRVINVSTDVISRLQTKQEILSKSKELSEIKTVPAKFAWEKI